MEKTVHCNCKTGCNNYRCSCRKNNEPCDENCGCQDCENPLNGIDVERLNSCALQNIAAYLALTEQDLNEKQELPCGCKKIALKDVINAYECECGTLYWYSFCWKQVVQDNDTWHCEACRQCRDWREWHCEHCNQCTYGISVPCKCGATSHLHELL